MEDIVKLTNSVYKILDFLPETDPLKNKAKEKALAVLENVTLALSAKGWVSLQKEKAAAQVLDDVDVLMNYLEIGKYQGWINNVNFLIFSKEYDAIKKSIEMPEGLMKKSLEINYQVSGEIAKPKELPLLNDSGYSARQQKILEMLGQRQKAQVSDLIKELPNVTKRTVRRDLDDLLRKGRIARVGEWNQVFYQVNRVD